MWTHLSAAQHLPALVGMMSNRLDALSDLAVRHPEGVVLRLPRRRLVVISDTDAVKHVLVDNARGYTKGLGQAEAARWLGDGLLTAEGLAWFEQRGPIADKLSASRVRRRFPEILDLAERSVAVLSASCSTAVDPRLQLAQYTTDALAMTLGYTAPDASQLVAAFDHLQDAVMYDTSTQGLAPAWSRPLSAGRARRCREELRTLAERAVASIEEQTPPWASPDRLLSLWLAGFETTAATLAWAISFLSTRPELQRELAIEGLSLLERPAELPRLQRVTDVFRETLRLRPPVWLISRRALEDDWIGGNRVRRGDDIAVCTHALHRGSSWHRAGDFDPDRQVLGRRLDFGQGPRACPGGALADLEASVWLAVACRELELFAVEGSAPVPVARLSQAPSAFQVQVRRRVLTQASTPDRIRGAS